MNMPAFLAAWIAKYGLMKVIGAGVILLVVVIYVGKLGWAETKGWYYQGKSVRLEGKLETSRAETKVARQDEKQVTQSAEITASTVEARDEHAADTRAATTEATEAIHERIVQVPVTVRVPDDPIVRQRVAEARARAQAAADRLRGTPSG
jgi:cytoskeletal protein RodZ